MKQISRHFNKTNILLFAIILFGLIIRLIYIEHIAFGYDQARDAVRVLELVQTKDIKILGPESDIPGIHHGPLYYYLIGPLYYYFQSPVAPAIFLIMVNILGIPLIFMFGNSLFNSTRMGLIAAFLYAISYEIFEFSRWLSNPSMSIVTLLLMFYMLWIGWQKKNTLAWIAAAVSLGLSIQLEVLYAFLYLLLIGLMIHGKANKKKYILAHFALFVTLITFILAEVKFNFMGINAALGFLLVQKDSPVLIMEFLENYLSATNIALTYNLFSLNSVLAFMLFISSLVYILKTQRKQYSRQLTFLLLCLFSTVPFYTFGIGTVHALFINIPFFLAAILLFAFFVDRLMIKHATVAISILVVVILGNAIPIVRAYTVGSTLPTTRGSHYLSNNQKVIDYIYNSSKGEEFSICSVTGPLFNNVVWSYMFNTYGKNTHGAIPYWAGSEQTMYDVLPADEGLVALRYIIIEPFKLSEQGVRITLLHENLVSEIVDSVDFDGIEVQKRLLYDKKTRDEKFETFMDTATVSERIDWADFQKDPRYSCLH